MPTGQLSVHTMANCYSELLHALPSGSTVPFVLVVLQLTQNNACRRAAVCPEEDHLCRFLPTRRYASAGLCDSDVSVRPSVCLSVCHTPVLCLAERKQDREMYTI